MLLAVDQWNALLSDEGKLLDPQTSEVLKDVPPERNRIATLLNNFNTKKLVRGPRNFSSCVFVSFYN